MENLHQWPLWRSGNASHLYRAKYIPLFVMRRSLVVSVLYLDQLSDHVLTISQQFWAAACFWGEYFLGLWAPFCSARPQLWMLLIVTYVGKWPNGDDNDSSLGLPEKRLFCVQVSRSLGLFTFWKAFEVIVFVSKCEDTHFPPRQIKDAALHLWSLIKSR